MQAVVFDPLSAYLAADAGFESLMLGGFAVGARLLVPDAILALADVAHATRQITRATNIPLTADAASGWGPPAHVAHAIEMLERAGADAIQLEDRVFPRSAADERAHALTTTEEMEEKIRAACGARRSAETLLMVRCGAMATEGYDGMIGRARRYRDAGADVLQLWPAPASDDDMRRAPRDLSGVPLCYINSEPALNGRRIFEAAQLEAWGWKLLMFGPAALFASVGAARDVYVHARRSGTSGVDIHRMSAWRQIVLDAGGIR